VVLLLVNLAFAALAVVVARRWWRARRAVVPVVADGVDLRVKAHPPDEDQVEEWIERALADVAPRPVSRISPPVVGDAATLVELAAEDADAVLAALVGVLLSDGYEVKRTKGRQVQLRRGPDRVVLEVAASD
jgi:hypothetical protein